MSKSRKSTLRFLTKADIPIEKGINAYLELKHQVTTAGILKRSYGFYVFLFSLSLIGLILSIYHIFTLGIGIQLALWTILFAFFAIQFGGLFHDAGHRSIFSSTKHNDLAGHIFSFVMAIPFSNWKSNHNAHHANPNTDDEDPDLIRPLISFSEGKFKSQPKIIQKLGKYQVYIYYPIGLFTLIFFQLSNVVYLRKVWKKVPLLESGSFLVALFLWLVAPYLFFPFAKALFVQLIAYGVAGFYMSNIFAPNHKGMPQFAKHTKLSFIEHQIVTTRNVNPSFINDYMYMGLNYQIEHHLFPNCPRNKLKLITPYVVALCKKMKMDFTSVGVIESNKIILSQLKEISKSCS